MIERRLLFVLVRVPARLYYSHSRNDVEDVVVPSYYRSMLFVIDVGTWKQVDSTVRTDLRYVRAKREDGNRTILTTTE